MRNNSVCTRNANRSPGNDPSEVQSTRTGAVQTEQPVTHIDTTKVLADPPRNPPKKATRGVIFSLVTAGALFLGIAAFGSYTRNQWTTAIQQRTNEEARMLVEVVHPEKSTGMIHLQLPGQTTPYTDAPIFAQTSGYLKKWYFDIGAKVKAGEVLAEIDTPELDQKLAQAKAQLKVAQAALDLAEVTYKRYQDLFKGKVISAQDFDTAADNYGGNQATVIADQANVDRLEALEAFKIIRAPFDGIVAARNTDIGAYVPAGSGTQLFRMAATSRLRVYVTVPQAFSSLIRVGEQADLTTDEFPGRKFPAHVIGTTGAINSDAKRLLTELEVLNPAGELLSGSYVQITLDIPIDDRGVTIPAETLLFPSGQPAVAVVHADGKVAIQSVTVIHDLARRLQVSGGISESDQLIKNPPSNLTSGAVVTVVKPPQNDR
jgi:RND family efflux transporter MFP subunit